MDLTERQRHEIEYHREYARQATVSTAVSLGVVSPGPRKWWNGIWHLYGLLMALDLRGKKVLVPGCGFGDDAARLYTLGAAVSAFDLSPDVIEVAKRRTNIDFGVMPLESMTYESDSFDLVLVMNILHHTDIPVACREIRRVLKPGGYVFGCEPFIPTWMRPARESWFVDQVVYPRMKKYIYGPDAMYMTPDERKIGQAELSIIAGMMKEPRFDWFDFSVGRLVPDRHPTIAKADRLLLMALGRAGRFLASRVIFSGVVAK